ncbi:LOW QUALITY PROTEIN: hypothetical protein BRADI_1g35210v3 [Brachypodium distachyon]|uniref:Uncharacterized protein n=2 Tax=Brachypodium distachyon TaxID=15368 RepID=A0A2K2DMR7_BRADI|nr:LOW QUALITY PROTEIN: hypothetical protein BRADI_1g35210v3 [Brachypodium distachyon]
MNHLLLPSPLPLLLHRPSSSKPLLLPHTLHRRHFTPKAAPDGNSGDSPTAAAPEPTTDAAPSAAPASSSKPTNVKDRLRSRNQSRRVQDAYPVEVRMMKGKEKRNDSAGPRREKPQAQRRRKEWDEMSLGEKALELYVGEKGALFWLNKFAYASIFIMAGAWILFRFVGPATGLYQLDAPPLAPTDVLRGSD